MALSNATFSNLGGAVSDIFGAMSAGVKAKGDLAEARGYEMAASLADQNARFTEMSTGVKEYQAARQLFQVQGEAEAGIGGAGLAASGGALDILRSNAQQGALNAALLGQQGLITEAGFKEQAQSYRTMAAAANMAAASDKNSQKFAFLAAGLKGAATLASLA